MMLEFMHAFLMYCHVKWNKHPLYYVFVSFSTKDPGQQQFYFIIGSNFLGSVNLLWPRVLFSTIKYRWMKFCGGWIFYCILGNFGRQNIKKMYRSLQVITQGVKPVYQEEQKFIYISSCQINSHLVYLWWFPFFPLPNRLFMFR